MEGERERERVQSSEDCGGSAAMLSAVRAETDHQAIVWVRTLCSVQSFAVEEGGGFEGSHCGMRARRKEEFLNFLRLSQLLLLLVSSPLPFGSGTRSSPEFPLVSDIRQIPLSLLQRGTFVGEIFSPVQSTVCW